jgi:prepilin-type N-terminal cleavage/methylation domain-containing protein
MRSYQTDPEAGFSLIEVLACVALLAIGISVAIGAVAAVARGNATATRRDVALMTARNIIARARAVAAY